MNKFFEIIIPERSKYPGDKTIPLYKNDFYFVNNTIKNLFLKNKTFSGEKLTAQINPEEGFFIYELIKKIVLRNV